MPSQHNLKASSLLTTFKLGDLLLKNRIALAPLTRARAGISRQPNDYMREYYEQRANAGLVIAEATAISKQAYGWYAAPGNYIPEHAKGWKKIVDAVHAKNAVMFLQLWHMGRQSHSSFHENNFIVAPSAIKIPGDGHVRDAHRNEAAFELPKAMSLEEIAETVRDYKRSAELALEAGFDGVEIHGANGYLIDTFLQSSTNIRDDIYGGSVENRYRFLREVIEAVAEVFPLNRIGVRLSPNGVYGGMGSPDNHATFTYVISELNKFGLAYLHLMDGLGFGFHQLDKIFTLFDARTHFTGPIISNIDHTKETGEGVLRTGTADLIAYGRPFISNPDLVDRFAHDWPLAAPAPYSHWYGTSADAKDAVHGYIDYPAYQPVEEEEKKNSV